MLPGLAYFGMSLFFVLSGFVIHYNYADSFAQACDGSGLGRATWQFFVARFARLYPLYFVSVFVSISHVPSPELSGGTLLAYLTLTQSWINVPVAVYTPAWSISAEWFFYFAFVPLVFVVRRITHPVLVLIALCALALAAVTALFNSQDSMAALMAFVDRWLYVDSRVSTSAVSYLIYMGPPSRLLEFIAGMLTAQSFLALRRRALSPWLLTVVLVLSSAWCAAVIGIAEITAGRFAPVRPNFLHAPALAAFMLSVCLSAGHFNRWLSSRPLLFMGEISYSVYVWSFFVFIMIGPIYRSPGPSAEAVMNSIVKVLVAVGLTTMIAYGSYYTVEMPARRWLRAKLSR